jgi:hypothetical protein
MFRVDQIEAQPPGPLLEVGDNIAPDPEPPVVGRMVDVQLISGDLTNPGTSPIVGFRDSIRVAGARWVQLHFVNTNLGERSVVIIRSVADNAEQRLNSVTLEQWGDSSAVFNGEEVSVEVEVAPGEQVSVEIRQVTVGDAVGPAQGIGAEEQLCGIDSRTPSADHGVGRTQHFCTGWIVSNGAHLTAGHCTDGTASDGSNELKRIDFEIPASHPDGTPKFSTPDNQYAVDQSKIKFSNSDPMNEAGDDWAVFGVHANPSTGLRPVHRQKAFYRLTDNLALPANVIVTGFGLDSDLPGTTGAGNTDNVTEQTDNGPLVQEVIQAAADVYLEYSVDTAGGNSGSPVTTVGSGLAIGIHTNGSSVPCASTDGNFGTSFTNDSLEQAIQTFPGPSVVYVDNGHPETAEDGTIFRPFDSVAEGVTAAPADAIVSIVTGMYVETPQSGGGLTIGMPMTLVAPVGLVTVTLGGGP